MILKLMNESQKKAGTLVFIPVSVLFARKDIGATKEAITVLTVRTKINQSIIERVR